MKLGLSAKLKIRTLALFLILLPSAHAEIIQRSHSIFFPNRLGEQVMAYQSFPAFWWNFFVIQGGDNDADNFAQATQTCRRLRALPLSLISRVECGQDLSDFRAVILDWVRDEPLRQSRPSDSRLQEKFKVGLTQASLLSSEPVLLDLLRKDPDETWKELKAIAEAKLHFRIEREQGFFYDRASHRMVIPLLLAFAPFETAKTRQLLQGVEDPDGHFIGAHFSTLQNEGQIISDLHTVSYIEIPLLIIFALLLWWSGRWQFFLLLPVVSISMGIATLFTYFIFGGIHGLTLSFGSGIIGLALDFGLHGALNREVKNIWRANLWGYFTTVAGLGVLLFSSIPLMRQLMTFSILGLSVGYVLYYFLITRWPQVFGMKPVVDRPRNYRLQLGFIALLIFSFVAGICVLKPVFNLAQFDFQAPKTREIQNWLFQKLEMRAPLFRMSSNAEVLARSHEEQRFARAENLKVENVAVYLPPLNVQTQNILSWRSTPCAALEAKLSSTEKKFFAPFIESKLCQGQSQSIDLSHTPSFTPKYLAHLQSTHNWVSIWFPESDQAEIKIKSQYPDAISIKELLSIFPVILAKELLWMIPLSLLLTLILLLLYYRNIFLTASALLPFLSGAGLVFLAMFVFHLEFSFISVVALVMVFGFSVDFGIFATDQCFRRPADDRCGVWSTLLFTAITTAAGFVPFLFCRHPVLKQLGQTLFCGALGAYLGSVWGIRGLAHLQKRRARPT